MEQNYQTAKLPTTVSHVASTGGVSWQNPNNIKADDGSDATLVYTIGGDDGADITGEDFGFPPMPDGAIIDGVEIFIEGSNVGCGGSIVLGVSGAVSKDIGTLNQSYGSPTDLWGLSEITPSDLTNITATVETGDLSGGDGTASIDYMQITVYWHVEMTAPETDVPTRIAYKVYSRQGNFLGELPKVTSKLAFPQDLGSAASAIAVQCGKFVNNQVDVEAILTDDDEPLLTDEGDEILATETDIVVAPGDSQNEAIFKNGNLVKVWVYNKYYPMGKLEFSGEMQRVNFKYGVLDSTVKLMIYSDGVELTNFVARGYPFSYTDDVSQTANNDFVTVSQDAFGGWQRYGQTFKIGAGVENIGAVTLRLRYTADVTLSIYDAPNGNLLGSVTKRVSNATMTNVDFEFAQLIKVTAGGTYFMAVSVASGQSIRVRIHSSSATYSDGAIYKSNFSGGSGGGSYVVDSGDFYFVTKHGLPTTTVTYSTQDPVTGMANGIMLDYNARGGKIKERDFEATGQSLTYEFVMAFIHDAIATIVDMAPTGYYSYVDLGSSEMDIKKVNSSADFAVTLGRHIFELDLALTIEQVKNYMLFSGGDTGSGNLYRDYENATSFGNFGLKTGTKSDNRVTDTDTADAIGAKFIEENSEEGQETMLTVLDEHINISLLTPGKTIGFRNFGNFIDDLVLQIVRREINFSDGVSVLTLGQLPIRDVDVLERVSRQVHDQQTINNPTAPS